MWMKLFYISNTDNLGGTGLKGDPQTVNFFCIHLFTARFLTANINEFYITFKWKSFWLLQKTKITNKEEVVAKTQDMLHKHYGATN